MIILLVLMSGKNMKPSGLCILFYAIIFLSFFINSGHAGDCEYGLVHAQVQTPQGVWVNATAHLLLHPGEQFRLAVTVTLKTSLSALFLKLHEFGTPVYEVVEGPTEMEQILSYQNPIHAGQAFTLIWNLTVLSNTSWIEGYAPLEIFVQFNKNDAHEDMVSFDAVIAYITQDEKGKMTKDTSLLDNQKNDVNKKECSTIFSTIPVLCVFLADFTLFMRVRKRKIRQVIR
jgi:sarcinarray family protein